MLVLEGVTCNSILLSVWFGKIQCGRSYDSSTFYREVNSFKKKKYNWLEWGATKVYWINVKKAISAKMFVTISG